MKLILDGNPTWVGSPALTFNNLFVFMDAKSGGGIEAYINMKEKDLAKVEGDGEFLAFFCPCVEAKNVLGTSKGKKEENKMYWCLDPILQHRSEQSRPLNKHGSRPLDDKMVEMIFNYY